MYFSKRALNYLQSLKLTEDSFTFSFRSNINILDLSRYHQHFNYLDVKFLVDNDESKEIGYASFITFDVSKIKVSEIRGLADVTDYHLYEAVSSVRLFPNKINAAFEKTINYQGYMEEENTQANLIVKDLVQIATGSNSHVDDYSILTFENQPYDDNTIDIWGKVLILDELQFNHIFNKLFLTKPLLHQLLKSLNCLGSFDWLIINPNIDDEYLKSNYYPVTTKEEFCNLLEDLRFSKTRGRLKDRYCYCKHFF